MSYSNDVSDFINQGKDKLMEETQKAYEQGKKQVVEGSKDWLEYVESHPMQTLAFGIIGYFALRGLLKK